MSGGLIFAKSQGASVQGLSKVTKKIITLFVKFAYQGMRAD